MGSVTVREAVKNYGALQMLHEVNLNVAEGEFVALVGPSGCGKFTLLRMIAGLEEISAGTISIGGTIVNDLPPKERNIAMEFQNYALYPHMNLIEGTVDKVAGTPAFRMADGHLWPVPNNIQTRLGDSVTYGVRPEKLKISPDGTPAEVEVVKPTGAETHVQVKTANAKFVAIDRNRLSIQPGDIIHIMPDIEKDHLFDTLTGLRLASPPLQ